MQPAPRTQHDAHSPEQSWTPVGLYLHVPFCAAICNYCNFNRGLHDDGLRRRFVRALIDDIRRGGRPDVAADTIFLGGGTPSLLLPTEVAAIIAACRDSFQLAESAEITLEANPESSTPEALEGFRAAGVNRLSFGVQSFRDAELQRLGRLHSVATAKQAVKAARAAGFENLSLDLMMWLPEQTVEHWLASVDELIAQQPEHASLYLLEIYPHAPLKDEMARADWSVAPDDDAAEMYLEGLARLDAAGFDQYEISNVARPASRQSRHNLKYWREGEWIGFGPGAHSTFGGERWRTLSSTTEYIDRVAAGRDVTQDRQPLDPQERLEEALFMGLRLVDGLDIGAVSKKHGVDIWARYGQDLHQFVEAGWLVHEPHRRLALTRAGMLLANEIMAVFIGRPVR